LNGFGHENDTESVISNSPSSGANFIYFGPWVMAMQNFGKLWVYCLSISSKAENGGKWENGGISGFPDFFGSAPVLGPEVFGFPSFAASFCEGLS